MIDGIEDKLKSMTVTYNQVVGMIFVMNDNNWELWRMVKYVNHQIHLINDSEDDSEDDVKDDVEDNLHSPTIHINEKNIINI